MEKINTNSKEGHLTEWLLRLLAILILVVASIRFGKAWWQDTSRTTILILLLTETYTLFLIIFARRAMIRDISPTAIITTSIAVFYYVFLETEKTHGFISETAAVTIQAVGISLQVFSKFTIGKSFGLLPAQRGLITNGPYSIVRHPIYSSYLISHLGFIAANYSSINLLVLITLYAAQINRIHREELMLGFDKSYSEYKSRVKWRLIPYVY